jgi:hypothetical protein
MCISRSALLKIDISCKFTQFSLQYHNLLIDISWNWCPGIYRTPITSCHNQLDRRNVLLPWEKQNITVLLLPRLQKFILCPLLTFVCDVFYSALKLYLIYYQGSLSSLRSLKYYCHQPQKGGTSTTYVCATNNAHGVNSFHLVMWLVVRDRSRA